jgi:uncharacterized protein with HEPN domain
VDPRKAESRNEKQKQKTEIGKVEMMNQGRLSAEFKNRLVEVLGEAVKRLPDDLRDRHPQLPWKKIAGTRDYIAHGYDSADYAAFRSQTSGLSVSECQLFSVLAF